MRSDARVLPVSPAALTTAPQSSLRDENLMLWLRAPALKGRPTIEKSLRDCNADEGFLITNKPVGKF
jgi:hypothetical protein